METEAESTAPLLGRSDLAHFAALACGVAAYATFLVRNASVLPPQGDAASHAIAAVELYERMAKGWPQAAQSLIYLKSSYPPLLYALTGALFGPGPSAAALPYASYVILISSLVLGWVLARARWGRAPAWVWVFLLALSPYFVGNASHYMLDLPLAATVGAGFVALAYSRSFDRLGAGYLFGLTAACGMMLKWAWLFFLGAPLGLCIVAALWGAGPTMRSRIPAVLAVRTVVAVVLAGCAWGKDHPPVQTGPDSGLTWQYVGRFWTCQGFALITFALAYWVRALRTIRGLLASASAAITVAGPWYLMAQDQLWARFDHESGVLAGRAEPMASLVAANAEAASTFFPFIGVMLSAAVLAQGLARPAVRADVALAVTGAGVGFYAITATLPFDPRYLLPLLPMAAGAVAATVSALPTLARWGLAGVVLATGLWALDPRGVPESGNEGAGEVGVIAVRERARNPDVTWRVALLGLPVETLKVQPALDFTGFYDAIGDIAEGCRGACSIIVKSSVDFWVQARTFEAAGRLAGITGAIWSEGVRPGDHGAPSRTGAEAGRTYFHVLQPCARRVHDRGSVERWRAEVQQATGALSVEVASYPLPTNCTMFLDQLVFD